MTVFLIFLLGLADAQKNNPLPPLPEVLCGTPEEVKQ